MRKALCVLSLVFPSVSFAQFTPTIFGVADLAARSIDNGGKSEFSLASGGLAASRLGVRAEDEFADGLKGLLWIEGTVNFDEGTSNSQRTWNRRSTVSVIGDFGEVRLGRDLTPSYTAFGEFDVFGTSGLADQGKFYSTAFGSGIESTGLWARADNMVTYFTPDRFGGLYAVVAKAEGEDVSAKEYTGGRFGYKNNTYNVSAAYGRTNALLGPYKQTSLSGYYDLEWVKIMASIARNSYLDSDRTVTQIGFIAPVLPKTKIRANYTYVNSSGTQKSLYLDKDDAVQIAVGGTYELSKQASAYATFAMISNEGNAAFVIGTPPSSSAMTGQKSIGTELGVSYRF